MPSLKPALIAAIVTMIASSASAAGDAAVGRAVARGNCGDCHAVGATDASPIPQAPPLRDLATRFPDGTLDEALAEGISVGHPMMPRVEMTPKQIADFDAYLRTLTPKTRRAARPAN